MDRRRAVAYIPEQQGAQPDVDRHWKGIRLDVVDTVRATSEADAQRAALGDALQRIADGDATVLLVASLRDAAGSSSELIALLDWLQAAGGDLVALDVRLDTAASAGRRTVATLREVERWRLAAAPGRPPRGRPGLSALSPELSARIAAMREQGLSLQAIAERLNADGVPTQRGGARWRPSSVQSALGYRRPRPPLPGAPALPAPPHGPAHGPHAPPRPGAGHPPRPPHRRVRP